MLRAENIEKSFGRAKALSGTSLNVGRGQCFGLLGANGAGKTTMLRIIAGIILPDAGRVFLDGEDTAGASPGLKRKIGYLPDSIGVNENLTVGEYLEFYAHCYGLGGMQARSRSSQLLKQMDLGGTEDMFIEGMSKGMKQRIGLVRALLHDPALIVLDEPTAGMDPINIQDFRDIVGELKSTGRTIIISSHMLSEVSELCTHAAVLNSGKTIAQGSMEEILKSSGAVKIIHVHLLSGVDAALQIMRDNDDVRHLMVQDKTISLEFSGDAAAESRLLGTLVRAGVRVQSFARHGSELEDAFRRLAAGEKERTLLHYDKSDFQA